MERKQRFFIYDRKEMGVLLLLGVMVAFFAFTLGVHLGKRVGPKGQNPSGFEASALPTVSDKLPNRQEIQDQTKNAQATVDESLSQALHDEVVRTGVKLDVPRQVQLPEKPRAKEAGATTPAVEAPLSLPKAAEAKVEVLEAARRVTPAGKFTLQIGSYPSLAEAKDQVDSMEALGLKPFLRAAEIKGKGKWYRVYLGGFVSKDEAEKAGQTHRAQHVIDSYILSKMPE
ncbi:MAG: SPOR domain-containing protein [Oligoflexia bacterium]|nr:SPOR domain-containing protein [Oligoflexia bacterium]